MLERGAGSRLLGTSALAGALFVFISATSSWAQEQPRSFDIPAESLSSALNDFGRVSGRQVMFTEAVVGDRRSPPLNGTYAPSAALDRLLAGSGLAWRVGASGVVMIIPKDSSNPQPGAGALPAPEAAQYGEVARLNEIVVTGTNIRGATPKAPITTITRSDFERQGFLDVGQALRSVPGNFSGGLNAETASANVQADRANQNRTGISSANLLGLGSGATLTLLNGRRLPVGGEGLAVDLSLIPTVAIERIDILADGASAIYGTDAVAGVVNVITRRNFDGTETRVRYGGTDGGLTTYKASIVSGGALGAAHGIAGVEYFKQGRLDASKRARAARMLAPTDLAGESDRTSYFASGQYDVGNRIQLFADTLYTQRIIKSRSTTATSFVKQNTKVSQYAMSVGASTAVGDSWTVDIFGNLNGNLSKNVNDSTSRTGVRTANFFNKRNFLRSIEARASGGIYQLPGGVVQLAAGAAYREEGLRSIYTPRTNTDRNVSSVYAELDIPLISDGNDLPLIQQARLTLAGRRDDYSDVGSVSVPKVGLSWDLTQELKIKANYSKSFRAPSSFDVANNYTAATVEVLDNVPSGKTKVLFIEGTGADLEPERAENFNVGITYEPNWLDGLKLSISYYDINYKERIAAPGAGASFGTDIRALPPQLLTRSPDLTTINVVASGAYLTFFPIPLSSVAAIVDARTTNISRTHVDGIQTSVSYRVALDQGVLILTADASYIGKFSDQIRPNVAAIDRVNTIFSPPELRNRTGVQWQADRWGTSVYWNHVNNYDDTRLPAALVKVDAFDTFDGSLSWNIGSTNSGMRLIASVTNLFDAKPPYVADNGRFSAANWDATNASVIGRFISLELVKKW